MTAFVSIEGSVAVITGAGSGIGRASALALARRGAHIVVTDLDEDRASAVASEVAAAGGVSLAMLCDVGDLSSFEEVRERTLERFGRIDIVMNNVGVIAMGSPETLPMQGWERVIDINLLGVVRSNLAFLPHLLSQGSGHIVNTASASGLLAHGFDRLPYVATKHALVGLTESLALYLCPRGIGVTCLCPSGVITNIVEQITTYGEAGTPRAPNHVVVEASVVGDLVVEAIDDGRFLVLTASEVQDELVMRANDMEAYINAHMSSGT